LHWHAHAAFSLIWCGHSVTDIPRLILEFITDKVLMEKDAKVQGDKLQKLLEVLGEARQIRARPYRA
jgi:hypothetical protein